MKGAWFTDCYYDYANTKTAPGHATIGTGAYSDGHGIESNEWWDASRSDDREGQLGRRTSATSSWIFLPSQSRQTSLARHRRCQIPGRRFSAESARLDPGRRAATRDAGQGKSLRRLPERSRRNSACRPVGQRCVLDRQRERPVHHVDLLHAALAGVGADTSSQRAHCAGEREANAEGTTQFHDLVGRTPAANSYEFDFAKALITGEKLGQRGVTDLVTISLSANDIQGHQLGPDSDSEEQMIVSPRPRLRQVLLLARSEHRPQQRLARALQPTTAVAPVPGEAAKLGMDAAIREHGESSTRNWKRN